MLLKHYISGIRTAVVCLLFLTSCIKKLIESGYQPYDAVIRFICAWKDKEDTEETAIILADVYFRRDK